MDTESKAASEGDNESHKSKPWAAYILGFNSVMVRLWQTVFWNMPGPEWKTWDSVPLCLDELETALIWLADELVPEVGSKIQGPIDGLRELHTAMIEFLQGQGPDDAFDFAAPQIPGVEQWRKLLFLADQALPADNGFRSFYSFGAALGRYQLALEKHEPPGPLPSLEELQLSAQTLSLSVVEAIPEFMMLAVSATEGAGEPLPTLMGRIVRTEPGEATYYEDLETWGGFLMKNRMTRLNYVIQRRLRGLSNAERPPERAEATEISPAPGRLPFVATSLQLDILKALKGKALMKAGLATACEVEPSRLYKKGGIKELQSIGVVNHQHGIGYFRPDKPPPEMTLP